MNVPIIPVELYIDPLLPDVDHHYTGPLPAQASFGVTGAIHHMEGRVLATFAWKVGGPVLELGSDHGVSTRYIHQGLDQHGNPFDLVLAIDRFHKWEDDAEWPRRIRLVHDTFRLSPGLARSFLAPALNFRWAFIDAHHSYEAVMRDTLLAELVGCKDIFYHDCNKQTIPPYTAEGDKGSGAYDAAYDVFNGEPGWKLVYIDSFCGMLHAHKE